MHCLFTVYSLTVLVFKHSTACYKIASYLYSPEHMLCPKSCEEPHSTNMRQVLLYQYVDDIKENNDIDRSATNYHGDNIQDM
jgi:hypothetical protein